MARACSGAGGCVHEWRAPERQRYLDPQRRHGEDSRYPPLVWNVGSQCSVDSGNVTAGGSTVLASLAACRAEALGSLPILSRKPQAQQNELIPPDGPAAGQTPFQVEAGPAAAGQVAYVVRPFEGREYPPRKVSGLGGRL